MEFCPNCGFRDDLCHCSSNYGQYFKHPPKACHSVSRFDDSENNPYHGSPKPEPKQDENKIKNNERRCRQLSHLASCSRCHSNPCCCPIDNVNKIENNPTNTNTFNPTNTNNFNPVINITAGTPAPTVTANNALIGLNAPTTAVAPNMPIPLDTNQVINGTAISHTPPSPIIFLEPNQTYLVEYSVYGTAPAGSGLNAALRLNGTMVLPFSEATNDFNFASPTPLPMGASGGAIINTTGNALNTLEVLNQAPTGSTIYRTIAPFFRAVSVRIVKLS